MNFRINVEIFSIALGGKGNEEIALLLNLSILTVKTQKKTGHVIYSGTFGTGVFRDDVFGNNLIFLFCNLLKMNCS